MVDLGLRPGLANDGSAAEALGNLATFELGLRRSERLQRQVLRVDTGTWHHFRLVVRRPDRALDLGFARDLGELFRSLSAEDVDALADASNRRGSPASSRCPCAISVNSPTSGWTTSGTGSGEIASDRRDRSLGPPPVGLPLGVSGLFKRQERFRAVRRSNRARGRARFVTGVPG